jgi:very-short-patch-repair endonuclease
VNRVVENFVPGKNKFDIVIVDEASQADLLSLPLMYMGEKIIVVGDDKQVTPESVGTKIEGVDKLIDAYLGGIPNRLLYDEKTSLYHIAGTSFEPICLREHFRCVSPIIQFSNYLCYHGKIKPLRDESDVAVKPHTVAYRVEDAYSDDKVNQVEALEIASLICSCIEQKEYEKMTFGVMSMVGDEQAQIIRNILMRRMHETDFVSRKIQCGNPAQFQGDERDVCFLSMVDSPKSEGPLSLRTSEANDGRYGKRFNVAASRAKNQLWVVYSMNSDIDLKPDDIRLKLIQHAKDPYALEKCYEEKTVYTESEFEKLVLKKLIHEGFDVVPQWKVGSYRIDMVIKCGHKKIALECDGEKYHTGEKIEEDMVRQALLERLGWKFIRIRGSQYFKDPESTMNKVINQLKENDIFTICSDNSTMSEYSSELIDRVTRRAEEIRREWEENPIDYSETKTSSRGGYSSRKIKKGDDENTNNSSQSEIKNNQPNFINTSVKTNYEQISIDLTGNSYKNIKKHNEKKTENNIAKVVPLQVNNDVNNKVINNSHNTSLNGTKLFNNNSNKKIDIVPLLKQKGYEVIDKREKGGAIWVVGGKELENELRSYHKYNYYFTFAPNGGTATKQRPAWFVR